MEPSRIHAAFGGLLERTSLSPEETRSLLRRARSVKYWRTLNPRRTDFRKAARPARSVADGVEHMHEHGYFQLDSIFSRSSMRHMRLTVESVRAAGWPAVFAMAYEEFWTILRTPPVARLLEGVLGTGYQMLPHMWCHYVTPSAGAHGWLPHVDGFHKTRVSLWIPFSDATLDNGCIYLVPQSRMPDQFGRAFLRRKRYSHQEASAILQNMRALPAGAGSVLGWNFGVVHWGTVASNAREPRVSAAYEFIAPGVKAEPVELPLLNISERIPSFDERLQMIGRALIAYSKFEPRMARYEKLAAELCG